jgi:hypothetical protein
MPFCPVCKYEYVAGITRCPDCDVDLVDKLDEEEAALEIHVNNEELVCVFQTVFRMEASVVEDMLKTSGIPVFNSLGMPLYGRLLDYTQEFKVYVLESNEEESLRLIKSRESEI